MTEQQQPDPADPQTMLAAWNTYQQRNSARDWSVRVMGFPFALTAFGYLVWGWPGWLVSASFVLWFGFGFITMRVDRREFRAYRAARDALFAAHNRLEDIP